MGMQGLIYQQIQGCLDGAGLGLYLLIPSEGSCLIHVISEA